MGLLVVTRALLFAGLVAWAAAVLPMPAVPANLTHGCVDRFDAAVDYFPDKATVIDATGFSVEYHRAYKIVTVKSAVAGGPPEQYVLVQCGAPAPALTGTLARAQVIQLPVTSVFVASTTYLPLLVDLGRLDVLTGVANGDFVDDPAIAARIKSGKTIEFARVGQQTDVELIVSAHPSLMIQGGTSPAAVQARNAGVPVVTNTSWLESTMLGRVEWLKYMAVFLNEEARAEAEYRDIAMKYRRVAGLAASVPSASRPLVMTGRSNRGIFLIAGGRSYVASLIHDAGARYIWDDNTDTGTPSIDLEAQIRRGRDADVWINGGGWRDRQSMIDDEPRYAEFKAYRTGQVWVYERRQTPTGANDYWVRGFSHPDLVLSDLIKIFHPSLLPSHAFEWYEPVPARTR